MRVIDASIMPVIIDANTNAPSMMIGGKGADMIPKFWATQHFVTDLYAYLQGKERHNCYYLNDKAN